MTPGEKRREGKRFARKEAARAERERAREEGMKRWHQDRVAIIEELRKELSDPANVVREWERRLVPNERDLPSRILIERTIELLRKQNA